MGHNLLAAGPVLLAHCQTLPERLCGALGKTQGAAVLRP